MYHFVPNEQWENVTNMYWRMTMKPMRLVISLIKKRYANASLETIIAEDPWALYGALTGFGLLVLGAGVGRWLVRFRSRRRHRRSGGPGSIFSHHAHTDHWLWFDPI